MGFSERYIVSHTHSLANNTYTCMCVGTLYHEEKRTRRAKYKRMRKNQIGEMNMSYERRYKTNHFSSSNSVILFFFGFGCG